MAYFDNIDLDPTLFAFGAAAEEKNPKAPGFFRSSADTGVALARGVVSGVKMLSDVAGADNAVSQGLGKAADWIGGLESSYAKWEQQQSASEMEAAADSGSVTEQIGAAGRAFARRPIDMTAEALGSSLPTIAAAFLPGGQTAAIVRIGAVLGLGAAQGAGAVKGTIYDEVRAEWKKAGAADEKANERAAAAQEYFGSNAGQIALGTALGAAAGTLGAEASVLGRQILKAAGQQPAKAGVAKSIFDVAQDRAITRVPMGAATEALPEALQGGQEKFAANTALGNEGFGTDPWRGVAGAAALEGMAGAGVGGAFAVQGRADSPPPAPKKQTAVDAGRAVMQAGSVDEAIAAAGAAVAFTPTEIPKPADGLELAEQANPDGIHFEADPRFAGAAVFDNGKAPAQPVFGSKTLADIHIGEQGAMGQMEAREVAPGRWIAVPTEAAANRQVQTNIERWMERAQPIPEQDAKAMAARAESELNRPMVALPMPDGRGWTIAPKAWVSAPILADYMEQAQAAAAVEAERAAAAKAAGEQPVNRAPRTPRAEPVMVDTAAPNTVAQFLAKVQATNTPQARAFMQEYRAGRITDAEILAKVMPPKPVDAPSADQRLAAAAAQAPKPEDGLLLTADGFPYGTRASAQARASRDGGQVIEVPGGYAVRAKESASADRVDAGGNPGRGPADGGAGVGIGGVVHGQQQAAAGDGLAPGVGNGAAERAGAVPARPGAGNDALTPGATFTLDGKTWTVGDVKDSAVQIADDAGAKRMVARNSKTFGKIMAALQPAATAPEPAQVAATQPAAQGAEADAVGTTNQNSVQEAGALAPAAPTTVRLKDGGAVSITRAPAPGAFSSLVRAEFGEPASFIAKDEKGEEVGRLTFMPNGGPIDSHVREQDRRRGIATALYDQFEAAGGKLPAVDSGVAISDDARAFRAARAEKDPPQEPPKAEKPQHFKTKDGASKAAKESGNTLKVQKVKDGFILRQKTAKEIEAEAKNAQRLARGKTVDTEADTLLTAIAKLGGLDMSQRADTVGTGNKNIGGKMLFRNGGKSIDTLANEDLFELGYIPPDEHARDGGVRWLRDAIAAEFMGTRTHNSQRGQSWMEQGTFLDPSLPVNTGANARMVVIEKPEGATNGEAPKFSRSGRTGRGISIASAEAIADDIRATMPEAPQIVVVERVSQLPEKLRDLIDRAGAENDIEGVFWDGKVWAVAGHFTSLDRFQFVVAHHELRHFGLGSLLGKDRKRLLMQIYLSNAKVRAAADVQIAKGLAADEVLATEEALADMPVEDLVKLRGWQRIAAAIRDFLRRLSLKLERKHPRLSGWLRPEAWTDEDIAHLVAKAEGVSKFGGATGYVRGGAVFSQDAGRAVDQTDTPAFRKWFGGSKVVDAKGNPLVVYHGGPQEITEFEPGRRDPGVWFTSRKETASGYAKGDGATIHHAYLSIANPLVADFSSWPGSGPVRINGREFDNNVEIVKFAQRAGHDGVHFPIGNFTEDDTTWVAFRPEQIKSAIGNNGDFDPDTADIRFSRAGTAKTTAPDWITSGSAALQGAAGKINTYAPQKTMVEKAREMSAGWQQKLVQGMFDAYAPLKALSMDAYIAARMTKAADGAFEGMLMYGKPVMNADGGITGDLDGKGFLGAMRELNGEHDRFFMWLAGNRAERLLSEGKENLFNADEIAAMKALNRGTMDDGRPRIVAFKRALDEFNTYSKSVLDVAEKAGLIDGESRKLWEHDFYVPFYRMSQENEISGPTKIKGLVRQKAFERLKGGTENLGDLMDNTLRNWSHLLSASLANVAASKSLLAAEQAGIAIEAKEAQAKEMAKAAGLNGNATYFMDQGVQRWFVVEDPAILAAISSMEAPALNGLPLQLMAKFKKYLTVGVTIAPAFKVRNLIRDTLAAPAANEMSFNIAKNLSQGWKATDTKTNGYAQMLFSGGLMRFGNYLEGDRAEHVKQLIAAGVDDKTILNTPQKVKAMFVKAWDAWQDFGDRMENVNRTALYQQLLDNGLSPREAAFQARDMMDFSLQGSWAATRTLTAVIPFLNARAQGLYKLGRAATDNPKRMGYMVAAVSLASIILMLAYEDDEDWKAREDWDRDGWWWFKVGDTAYRIPKPFEIGAMGTIAERSLELAISDEMTGARFAERMKQMVTGTFAINPVPQMFKPMMDLYANKDSFTGRQIETLGMERLSKPERYGPNTTALAKALGSAGEYTGVSPVQVDHLIRAYFGWLGTMGAATVDAAVMPFEDFDRPAKKIDDYFGGFVKELPAASSRYLEDFYKQAQATSEAMADLRRAREVGDTEAAAEIMEERGDKVAQYRIYQQAQRQFADLNKRIRIVRGSTELDADTKRLRLDELTELRNRIARQVSDRTRAREAVLQ